MYSLTWVATACRCLQCTSLHLNKSPSVIFISNKKIIHTSTLQFFLIFEVWSEELSSFAAKNLQQEYRNLFVSLTLSQKFFWACFSPEENPLPQKSPGFFHCSKFSSSPERILTVSFSHANSWCRSYGWTDFLKVVGQMTMSAKSRRTPRDKGHLPILEKHWVKDLEVSSFSRLQCMNTSDLLLAAACRGYWRLPHQRHPDKLQDLLGRRSMRNSGVLQKKVWKIDRKLYNGQNQQ